MQNSYYGSNMFPEPPNGPTVSAPPYRTPRAGIRGKTVALIVSLVLLAVILFTAVIGSIVYIAANNELKDAMQRKEYAVAKEFLVKVLQDKKKLTEDTRITLISFSNGVQSIGHGIDYPIPGFPIQYSTFGFRVDDDLYEITCHYDNNGNWYACRECSIYKKGVYA